MQEKMNQIMNLRNKTQLNRREFSEQYGIPLRTIEDWEHNRRTPPEYLIRLLSYKVEMDHIKENKNQHIVSQKETGQRNVNIICDTDGRNIVLINDILFKGKRNINWKEVRRYLRNFVGNCYEIEETAETVYIGNQLPTEYAGSNSRLSTFGAAAKAKANLSQGLPELIQTAQNPIWEENKKDKHTENAKYGWYKYDVRFALPVYDENNELKKYNIYNARLLVNHASNGKKYLYDILAIKKETSSSQHDV